jgi:glycosyltransferase involved in cell wall biosynthesis
MFKIGFVGTRFAGLDGVSLEASKWAEVLEHMGHKVFWWGGELEKPDGDAICVPEAFFKHPANRKITEQIYGKRTRDRSTTDRIQALKNYLKDKLYEFVDLFDIDMLIAENCLSIPIHIPLGVALTELIAETGIPTIGHHHDLYWERTRFLVNSINDYLEEAFPPDLPSLCHVVINSIAQKQLAARKGVSSILIPNVIDFEKPVVQFDDFNRDFRSQIGLAEDDIIFLQPTRIVARKGIEQAINLVERLNNPRIKLLISHSSGDEGMEYYQWLLDLVRQIKVPVYFIDNRLHERRRYDEKGNKIYSLWDVYPHADFITYPSAFEGFGNAFLEAVYFRKPILVNRYPIFVSDIEPKGFKVAAFDGFLADCAVEQVKRLLSDGRMRDEMVGTNFALAQKYFSYDILKRKIQSLFTEFYGTL